MKQIQWETLINCSKRKEMDIIPVALIVDSPWIPGYCGISTMDYFTMPDIWWDANMKIHNDFPEIIFVPDFWLEYGMAAEPSGYGCKISFFENTTPNIHHLASSAEDISVLSDIALPNPKTDGLMPFILNNYKKVNEKANEVGERIKIVAARGPLTTAAHMMGLTEFLIAVKIYPDKAHKLIKNTAQLTKNWLEAQADVLRDAEGILVLDDVVGLLSKDDYLEFAHPYMEQIFSSFENELKIYHNDTDNPASYPYMKSLNIDIFNFTHLQDIKHVRELTGDGICLMGNIAPLDLLVKASADEVKNSATDCIKNHGSNSGILLSTGGGVSPGTPKENILSLINARDEFGV